MFDLSFPVQPTALPAVFPPAFASTTADPSLPFALATPDRSSGAVMSGGARPCVLDRFAAPAAAMQGAVAYADQIDGPDRHHGILDPRPDADARVLNFPQFGSSLSNGHRFMKIAKDPGSCSCLELDQPMPEANRTISVLLDTSPVQRKAMTASGWLTDASGFGTAVLLRRKLVCPGTLARDAD